MPEEASGPNGPHPKLMPVVDEATDSDEKSPFEHLVIGNSHVIVQDDSD
jgi:hypothetical protein